MLAATSTEAQDVAPLPVSAPAKAQKPARGKRSPLPPELERVEIIHDVPESERTCDCGTPMVVINRVISEQLDIVPMQVRVLQHITAGVWMQDQRTRTGNGGVAAATLAQEQCQSRFAGDAVDDQVCRWLAAGKIREGAGPSRCDGAAPDLGALGDWREYCAATVAQPDAGYLV